MIIVVVEGSFCMWRCRVLDAMSVAPESEALLTSAVFQSTLMNKVTET